jgi:MoaA/NifB/PqqE/SkfB family radical SAM enzyme
VKSDFMTAAEHMRQVLGEGLCLAKWKQVSLHLPTGLNNSCYHPPLHRMDANAVKINPATLHNTEHKKEQRRIMLRHERPAECSYCWAAEDNGQLSDRHYRSGESWAAEDLEAIANSTGDEDWIPSYVEVNFNHACNLKCSYCSPQFSSSWLAEVEAEGGYPTRVPHNSPDYFLGSRRPIPAREYNPYVEAFWQWWPELYPKLRHFRMTGGEPLMDHNTYRVFDYVLALPNPLLHLDVTSNFSVEEKLFDKYIGYVKRLCDTQIEHFMQYVSVDSGVMEQAEYIRHGLDSGRLINNVERYLSEVPNRNSLTLIVTMNNLSITGLQDLLDWILELRAKHSRTYQRVWFDTPLLRQPTWQSIQTLPPAYQYTLANTIEWMKEHPMTNGFVGFKDYEIQRMERNLAWMSEPQTAERLARDRADFYKFFNEHDRRRGTDFLKTFPNMQEFWNECKYHAEAEQRN